MFNAKGRISSTEAQELSQLNELRKLSHAILMELDRRRLLKSYYSSDMKPDDPKNPLISSTDYFRGKHKISVYDSFYKNDKNMLFGVAVSGEDGIGRVWIGVAIDEENGRVIEDLIKRSTSGDPTQSTIELQKRLLTRLQDRLKSLKRSQEGSPRRVRNVYYNRAKRDYAPERPLETQLPRTDTQILENSLAAAEPHQADPQVQKDKPADDAVEKQNDTGKKDGILQIGRIGYVLSQPYTDDTIKALDIDRLYMVANFGSDESSKARAFAVLKGLYRNGDPEAKKRLELLRNARELSTRDAAKEALKE